MVIIIMGIFLWSLLIFARLVQKQIVEHEDYARKAEMQQQTQGEVAAPRGVIYDNRMDVLASNTTLSTVIAEPRRIKDIPETAEKLASVLGVDRNKLLARMERPELRSYLVVQRRIDENKEKAIAGLNLDGVYFIDESTRSYPNNDLACHVLGFVNMNGDGGAGIEQEYDKYLKGKPGRYTFARDGKMTRYQTQMDVPPVQGNSLVLSIDKSIQYITDRELAAGAEKAQARAGTAIVMESDTGRIIAMSNYPRFDSNRYNEYKTEYWYNRAVTDIFEPGSTFKVAVAAAALKEGLTRPDEMIDCQNGAITIGGHVFRDHSKYGLISFKKILAVSSNVGAAKLGLRLGQERLYEYIRAFGFGSPTGIDLPREEDGIVRHWSKWSGLSIGAVSFGHEVGVTSMQILAAVNTIANGGFRVRPSIVDRIIDSEGNLVKKNTPEKVRILDEKTALEVSEALKEVVLPGGTARRAALNGYVAAGKTGTAQKIVKDPVTGKSRYSNSKYVASFIGFAPLPNPKITVLVQLDEPGNGHYGGEVSAPIFHAIAQETLMRLKIPPDPAPAPAQPKSKQQFAKNDAVDFMPAAASVEPVMELAENRTMKEDQPGVITVLIESESVVVPDFRGMSKRRVLDICLDLDVRLKSDGSGVAVSQNPPPGARIVPGAVCSVVFARPDELIKKETETGGRVNSSVAAGRL
ncbi:MAG: transpeptidase family protein [Acidobacteria bacterium]|nr:transpeptidase family protein [Acidobacteriota bacterium]